MPSNLEHVIIVGGGAIGSFTAYRLSLEGVKVTLVERRHPGAEASGRSAGNVQPRCDSYGDLEAVLGVESLRLYKRYLPSIKEEAKAEVRDQNVRYLFAAVNEEEVHQQQRFLKQLAKVGLDVEWIDGVTARELEPRLSPEVVGGVLHRDCIQLDPQRFVEALATAAQRHGVRIETAEAVGLEQRGDRISGVLLDNGSTLSCDTVVLAMGAWNGVALSRWAGIDIPIGPYPLQKLHLRPKGNRLGCAVCWGGINIVSRLDGLVHSGSKHDEFGLDPHITQEGRQWILDRVTAILPGLEFEVVEAVAGVSATTTHRGPILGPIESIDGLYVVGAIDDGFHLSAVLAHILTNLLVRGEEHPLLDQLLPARILGN